MSEEPAAIVGWQAQTWHAEAQDKTSETTPKGWKEDKEMTAKEHKAISAILLQQK